jgi:integrase
LKTVQRVFRWLSVQTRFKPKNNTNAIADFNLADKDIRAATSAPMKRSLTMDQLKRVLAKMPLATIFERRVRAVFALFMMAGICDNAAVSILLGHIDRHPGLFTGMVLDAASVGLRAV